MRNEYFIKHGYLSLVEAIYSGDRGAVEKALGEGADIEQKDTYDRTPLMMAAYAGRPEMIKMLIKRGAQLEQRDAQGHTALVYAVGRGCNTKAVALLIESGARLDFTDQHGRTLRDIAKYNGSHGNGSHEIEKMLEDAMLRQGLLSPEKIEQERADKEAVKKAEKIRWILSNGKISELFTALDEGTDPYAKVDRDGSNALTYCLTATDCKRSFLALLLAKVNPNTADSKGDLPLTLAVKNGFTLDVQHALIKAGADINLADGKGKTALDYAMENGYPEPISFLLKHGANQSAKGADGLTPLMRALKNGKDRMAMALIENGADILATDPAGKTAYDYAAGMNTVQTKLGEMERAELKRKLAAFEQNKNDMTLARTETTLVSDTAPKTAANDTKPAATKPGAPYKGIRV